MLTLRLAVWLLTPCTSSHADATRAALRGNGGLPQAMQADAAATGANNSQAGAQAASNMSADPLHSANYTRRGRRRWTSHKTDVDKDKQVTLLLLPFHPSQFASSMHCIRCSWPAPTMHYSKCGLCSAYCLLQMQCACHTRCS